MSDLPHVGMTTAMLNENLMAAANKGRGLLPAQVFDEFAYFGVVSTDVTDTTGNGKYRHLVVDRQHRTNVLNSFASGVRGGHKLYWVLHYQELDPIAKYAYRSCISDEYPTVYGPTQLVIENGKKSMKQLRYRTAVLPMVCDEEQPRLDVISQYEVYEDGSKKLVPGKFYYVGLVEKNPGLSRFKTDPGIELQTLNLDYADRVNDVKMMLNADALFVYTHAATSLLQ